MKNQRANGSSDEEDRRNESVDEDSVEYIPERLDFDNNSIEAFSDVFARFQLPPDESEVYQSSFIFSLIAHLYLVGQDGGEQQANKGEIIYSDDDAPSDKGSDDEQEEVKPMSKRKQRKLARLTVAELKQLVKKPEVVEWTDVTASDPRLLIHLKSSRNTIPVPTHWSAKRDYLQGKRGIEKPPFQLPSYIADTGIATMRDAVKEKEANMSLKAKTRERVQPKMGKMDIDYQKLHDAFFKFQTKPPVTGFGEM